VGRLRSFRRIKNAAMPSDKSKQASVAGSPAEDRQGSAIAPRIPHEHAVVAPAAEFFLGVSGRVRRSIGSIHDLFVAALALFISYSAAYGFNLTLAIPHIGYRVALFCLAAATLFYLFGLNRGAWRYASLPDVMAIWKASLVLVLVYLLASFLFDRSAYVPRAQPIVLLALLVSGLSASRALVRLFKENGYDGLRLRSSTGTQRRNALLYGLTRESELFLRGQRVDQKSEMNVVAMIDDDPQNRKAYLQGIKVKGTSKQLTDVINRFTRRGVKIDEIIIGQPTMSAAEMSHIVDEASALGIVVTRLPNMAETVGLDVQTLTPRAIDLADLLERPEIKLDTQDIARLIDGRSVIITGAGGSIGSELARQTLRYNPRELILVENSEHALYATYGELITQAGNAKISVQVADVRDRKRIVRLFKSLSPDIVFHAAALKHVPIVEANALEAIKTNLIGTKNAADAAMESGVRSFVLISTDKAVNPVSILGATKRAAEIYCQSMDIKSKHTRFTTVRFGNVIGSSGSVVPLFQKQIERSGPVTVTHPNVMRYFMSVPEAVQLVLFAAANSLQSGLERGNILVLNMGNPVKIDDLARKMIQMAGLRPDIDIEIKYVGLRPGEKLFEALFSDDESAVATASNRYSVVRSRTVDEPVLQKCMSELRAAIDDENESVARRLLSHLVQDYRPWTRSPDEMADARAEVEHQP